jgi:hypothetical protein
MKAYKVIGLIVIIFLLTGPVPATAYTIDDSTNGSTTYWGGVLWNGNPTSVDVIGNDAYAINGINVIKSGTSLTVQVIGPYFSPSGARSDSINGDLYISSTGWKVSGSPHYSSDTFLTDGSEGWNYVIGVKQVEVVIDNRRSYVPVLGVYKLSLTPGPPQSNNFQYTNVTLGTLAGGRALQAWKGGYGDFVESATITQDDADSMLIYTFDGAFLGDNEQLGLHWTMICGNDVVEGGFTQVPEPGTLLLLGGGLIALGALRRKFGK